ncbi:B3 domain-containing transcription factor VRN1-like isoform X2 [Mercurialis annua]|uniref:B3 domain-containing transcription factor VRN1-like isoform X2 n=1 Tax=Mercurialis annua TaxID=3986 RepID=UPI0024AE42E8|nr:B3 domain-containing transcription factor VRN1-like isoform X2 [Mercurialis annua]
MARRRVVETSGEAHRRRSKSLADKPKWRFFKIILPRTLTEKKLRIPIKFVRRFRDELSDVANFIVPNGCNWEVAMRKEQNDIWFDDGWHDFVEHYLIGNGYFVIFAYRGFSNFSVFIFDTTACEIEYTENVGSPVDGESLPVPKCEDIEIITVENSEFREVSLESKAALELARQYKPKHPCFMVVLHAYNCYNNVLHVPSKFSRRDNNLKAGDVCVLEMIKCKKAMKVTVYAVQDNTKIIESDSTDLSPECKTVIHADRNYKPKNPCFKVLLGEYCNHDTLHVPRHFSKKYIRGARRYVKLEISHGRVGTIFLIKGHRRAAFGKGWQAFCREHNLKAEDVCVFELMTEKCDAESFYFSCSLLKA